MIKLYAARHGQTEWNSQNRILSRTDQPLTELGLQQAELLAQRASGCGIDVIYVSPMLRARQTAQAVSRVCGAPVIVDERLTEHDYGIYEGRSRKDPEYQASRRQFASRYPGGESLLDVTARVYDFLRQLKAEQDGKTVLVVCHGGICRAIRTCFENMSVDEYFGYSEENANLRGYDL